MSGLGKGATEEQTENPAQQLQMQKGEQASSWDSSDGISSGAWIAAIVSVPTVTSAHGTTLKERTRMANMAVMTDLKRAKIYRIGKYRVSGLKRGCR